MLSENNFETVLVNFCCYGYGDNVSEAVQKISLRAMHELCQYSLKVKTANLKNAPMRKHI